MPKLPILSGKEIIKTLEKIGYRQIRQRGSHIRLSCPGRKFVTVPNHKTIGRGLLRKILRDVKISKEEFKKLLTKR